MLYIITQKWQLSRLYNKCNYYKIYNSKPYIPLWIYKEKINFKYLFNSLHDAIFQLAWQLNINCDKLKLAFFNVLKGLIILITMFYILLILNIIYKVKFDLVFCFRRNSRSDAAGAFVWRSVYILL